MAQSLFPHFPGEKREFSAAFPLCPFLSCGQNADKNGQRIELEKGRRPAKVYPIEATRFPLATTKGKTMKTEATTPAKRGRKPLYATPEEKAAARAKYRKASKATTKNVSLDADLVGALNEKADELETLFGFRPTHSQTLRFLLKGAK